ncbi:MAG: prepilin peptidase [bacterium]
MSLSTPLSRCSSCLTRIRWYDNVPVLSWWVLRGRCRACGTRFSPRYMLIEAMCGLLGLALWRSTVDPLDPDTFTTMLALWLWLQAFVFSLVALTFIDLEHTFIPEEISVPLLVLGLAGGFFIPGLDPLGGLYGALAGGGFLLLVTGVGWLVYRREAMGLGDAMLLAVIGAFLGVAALPFVLVAAAFQALAAVAIAGLYQRLTGKRAGLTMTTQELDARFGEEARHADLESHLVIPFGPFLALGALEALFFGHDLIWRLADAIVALVVA